MNSFLEHAKTLLVFEDFKLVIAFAAIAFSMATTLFVLPKIVYIGKLKNLTATTNDRTSHIGIVPNLGGVAVFVGLILTVNIATVAFANYEQLINVTILNILLFVLLLVGVYDDIMNIPARKKLLFQLLTAFCFVVFTDYAIVTFDGLLGVNQLNHYVSIGFTVFVMVLIINAYNLIDGIDGLAGSIGAVISGTLSFVFYNSGHFLLTIIALALVGALTAFLIYNFSHKRKIFLGDTGSMVVGFVLATLVVLYLNFSVTNPSPLYSNAPLFVLALLSYPLLDTLRVFLVRIKMGRSPFMADRNHIHHRLLDLGLSHKHATLCVVLYTLTVISLAYMLNDLSINYAFGILLPISLGLLAIPFVIQRKENGIIFRIDFSDKK